MEETPSTQPQAKIFDLLKSFLAPLIALALFGAAVPSIRVTFERAHWFQVTPDEAIHAEVIESLAQIGRYALWAPEGIQNPPVPQKGSLGALNLTTGPTLIVPAALLEKATGLRAIVTARLVSLTYFVGMLVLLFLIASHLCRQHQMNIQERLVASVSAVGFFFLQWRALQDTNYYSFAILGEGPAVFFVTLALWSALKNRFTWAGAACSLAALSKPYFLFLPFSFGFLLFVRLFRKNLNAKNAEAVPFSRAFFWPSILGLIVPFVFVFISFLVAFGPQGTVFVLRSYPSIMKAANGMGFASDWTPSLEAFKSLVLAKLHAFPTILKLRGEVFLVIGAFLSLRLSYRSRAFAPLIVFAWLHLIWWFFFTGSTVSRYLMPAYLVFTFVNFTFVVGLMKKIMARFTRGSSIALVLAITCMIAYHAYHLGWNISKNWKNLETNPFYRQTAAQNFWRLHLKDASSQKSPLLYSTSTSAYAHDLDYVISQPYEFSSKKLIHPTEPFPNDGWIVLGELPESTWLPAIQKALQEGKCQNVAGSPYFDVGRRGFYSCH